MGVEVRAVVTNFRGGVVRKRQKLSGVMEAFCIFGEVVVTELSAFAKTHRPNI